MAISFSRPDPSSPTAVAAATFTTARKGFEPSEVRDFLRMVAAELARLQERERFLERELKASQRIVSPSSISLDEELVTRMLGEETARILHTARDAASQIKIKAEEAASRLLQEANDEARRVREESELEAARRRHDVAVETEAELEHAKQQGRDMVEEARAYRERVLGELARRRDLARQQIEQLVDGRDRLLQAFERARLVSMEVVAELAPLDEPEEYVNLATTTGPVPLMVRHELVPGVLAADEPDEPDDVGSAVPSVEESSNEFDEPVSVEEDEDEASVEIVDEPAEGPVDEADDQIAEASSDEIVDETVDESTEEPMEVPAEESGDEVVDTIDDEAVHEVVEPAVEPTIDAVDAEAPTVPMSRPSPDDLFARLRAARADTVAQRARSSAAAAAADEQVAADLQPQPAPQPETDTRPETDSVFAVTPVAPPHVAEPVDSPFARRDEVLTPLIVASARKLKRALADEQNDVLHVLRGRDSVRSVSQLLGEPDVQLHRYASAIEAELLAAAEAGAASVGAASDEPERPIVSSDAVTAANDLLLADVVQPLRDRLERALNTADGDNTELASLARVVYREWKTQRIDEYLDDVARTAFGHGALAGVAPGTPLCWIVDPAGPECPDAEDNSLAGAVPAGDAFPTEHRCAPAHSGCRCMVVRVAPA